MFRIVLLFLFLSGLQAAPLAVLPKASLSLPDGLQQDATHPDVYETAADGFRQGTEPSRRLLVDLNTGLVKEHIGDMNRRAFIRPSDGKAVMEQRLADDVLIDAPVERNGGGWVRMEEPSSHLPHGFSQGTEPKMSMPEGFSQGTEPKMLMPEGFSRGTEPKVSVPKDFRQGTEPSFHIPEGFRQGTENLMSVPVGFRQGTEPSSKIPESFKSRTEPSFNIPEGFRQGTEPILLLAERTQDTKAVPGLLIPRHQPQICKGEIISGRCYEFNPTPLAFQDAQVMCRGLAPNAELASISNNDVHTRLVSLVTNGGNSNPVLTWIGGIVEDQQASWVDGSEWNYSDWMPGHPNVHSGRQACVEMFNIDESWWTANDCGLKRASICSYPITA